MAETTTMTLEEQIAALQQQIDFLKNGGMSVTPSRKMQNIRKEIREKYFGSFEEMRTGEIQYGPSGKSWSDYGAIEEIITKASGLIFKYSYGKSCNATQITNLLKTQEDEKRYREICESLCRGLRESIDKYFEEG